VYFALLDAFFPVKVVPPLFLYFLLTVSMAGEVGVTSMLSLEMGAESPQLEMGVASLSLLVGVVPDSLLSLVK